MNHLLRTSERLRARALLRTVTCALGLAAAVSGPAVAADTDIADYPMSVANMAKSNVMFVLDNSGGMDVDTLLPTFNSMYYESNIPKTQQTTTTLFGFFYFQPNKQVNGANRAGSFYLGFTGNADANAWKARNAKSNPQYYDPTLTYKPWLGVDSSGATFANANPASAYLDPYIGASGGVNNTFNLQQWYAIPNAATYLSNATGPASAIPSYTTPGTGIQYCDTTAHTGAATYPSSGTITYTKCNAAGGARGYASYMWPASFYMWNDRNGNGSLDGGEGDLYMINCSTASNPLGNPLGTLPAPPISNAPYGQPVSTASFTWTRADGSTFTRTCAQELQNFANWFQYSRTVMLSLKGAMGISLSVMGAAKVGVNDLKGCASPPPNASCPANPSGTRGSGGPYVVSPVADMSVAANLAALYKTVYSIQPDEFFWDQPFHERIWNTWNYYNTARNSVNPPAPIQYACEQNFEVLVTPGYLNDPGQDFSGGENYLGGNYINNFVPSESASPRISPTNYDGTSSSLAFENGTAANPNPPPMTLPQTWSIGPYTDTVGNTLADFAAYFYDQTLRTDLPAGQVPIAPGTQETNPNLHMSTYVMAPAAQPILQTNGTFADPQSATTSGTIYPPYPPGTQPVWPTSDPGCSPSSPAPCFVGQSTIDDLWHTAINGRGIFVNSADVSGGLQLIVDDILARISAAAAVAVNNANIVQGSGNQSYVSSYITGAWTGDLQSYPIDLNSADSSYGAPLVTSPIWNPSAQKQIDAMSVNSRYIATYDGHNGIPFAWSSLSLAMQAELNSPQSPPGPSDGSSVLRFLRGSRRLEGTTYRPRTHLLGDIIHAEPVVVLPPGQSYIDPGYAAFATANAGRTGMVYQGANDGMLHAFVAATGAEAWAYVPGLLFNSAWPNGSNPGTSTLVNLSLLTGFMHLYYVDGTPTAGDVDLSYTAGNVSNPPSPSWHTMLVGGLAKGGRGYYALDVTSPGASSDANVASKVMWEFPNSTTSGGTVKNIGYSFGKPAIVKTAAAGWVVLVTSGYNNGADTGGDGQGHLFVLNPVSGAVIADISTGVGNSATPSGLAQISAWVDNTSVDNTVTYVYGGDLLGNLWRFDLTAANTSGWTVTRLASLVDPTGAAQPVTSAPELGLFNNNHLIFVGTGQYLGNSDIPGQSGSNSHAAQTETMYGLLDNLSASPLINPLRSHLVRQAVTWSGSSFGSTASVTNNPVDYSSMDGWYIDLPGAGERVNTDPSLGPGVLVFTSNSPSNANACSPGGTSAEYFVNYSNGGPVQSAQGSSSAPAGIVLGTSTTPTLASRPLLIKMPSGKLISLVRQSNATTNATEVPTGSTAVAPKRIYWREIMNQ